MMDDEVRYPNHEVDFIRGNLYGSRNYTWRCMTVAPATMGTKSAIMITLRYMKDISDSLRGHFFSRMIVCVDIHVRNYVVGTCISESPNGARAPVLQKKLNPQKFILKNYEKIIVVENTMIHQCEKFQTQTLYILICVKKRNLGRFQIFEIAHCSSIQICTFLFLPRTEYKEFLI